MVGSFFFPWSFGTDDNKSPLHMNYSCTSLLSPLCPIHQAGRTKVTCRRVWGHFSALSACSKPKIPLWSEAERSVCRHYHTCAQERSHISPVRGTWRLLEKNMMGKMEEHAWQEDICPLTHAWVYLSKHLCHLWDQKPTNVISREWRHERGRFLSPQNVFTVSPGSLKSAKSQVSVS